MAADPLVAHSFYNPSRSFDINVNSTINILEAVRKYKPKIFVNFTTDKVYKNEDFNNKRFKEEDAIGGTDPYSVSKSCSDLITQSWRETYFSKKKSNTYISAVRCGNIIGGGDWNQFRIIPDIIGSIYQNKKITIRDISAIRPWLFVMEPVIGLILLIQKMLKNNKGFCSEWNFGPKSLDEKNVGWIISESEKFLNKKLKLSKKKKKKNSLPEKTFLRLSSKKSIKKLNWKMNFSAKDRLHLTLSWYKKFFTKRRSLLKFTEEQTKDIEKKLNIKYI